MHSKEHSKDSTSSYKYGRWLANPPEGEEVVISGLAGYYPNCKNVYEFRDNLFNKVDMISDDERRWKHTDPEIPQRTGKLNDIEKFDAGYFGIHEHQAHTMDPIARLFMERSVEAILDAGFNPKELEGTNTGVFFGICFSETEKTWFFDKLQQKRFAMTGCMRSMFSDRLSYYLKLKGPSCIVDTACSSSLYALEHAYRAIREGKCDSAIVGGINLCLRSIVELQFTRLGVLSPDGKCKVFDEKADGYVRSEGSVAIFLQKTKDARRIYCQLVHVKTNSDGYKANGITYPSVEMQSNLIKEVYNECQINPVDLTYLEAHGTGTVAGDPVELSAMDQVFWKNRKIPLLIGSVKSNIGHGEPVSGLSSVSKAIIAFETGLIPPNLNYVNARSGIEALEEGRFKVVTESTPLPDDRGLIGINNFGFGGSNCHILLKWNKKEKCNDGHSDDNLPQLVCVSGRGENSVISILDDIKNRSLDAEYISLFHQIFNKKTLNHLYRGYSIISKSGELKRSLKTNLCDGKPLCLFFSNFGVHWKEIAKDLFCLPLFVASVQRIKHILLEFKSDITEIILNADRKSNFDQILGNMAIQIGIVDLLKTLKIETDNNFSYGFGKFISDYFNGFLDLKQTVITVYKIASNLETFSETFSHSNGFWTKLQQHLPQLEKRLNAVLKQSPESVKYLTFSNIKEILAEYFHQNLINTENIVRNQLKEPVIIFEIGNTNSSKINTENNEINFLNFEENENKHYFVLLLELLGCLYQMGYSFELDKLYPKVQFPVSRGTPMISPLIKWNHKHDWFVYIERNENEQKTIHNFTMNVSIRDEVWQFISGHVIDGRNLFPATGYLNLIWKTFSLYKRTVDREMAIVMENCKFQRATSLDNYTNVAFNISFQKGTEMFEILEGSSTVASGTISLAKSKSTEKINLPTFDNQKNTKDLDLTAEDIYKELRLRGYNYSGFFKKIINCNSSLTKAYVRWDGNWVTFMDNLLQLKILQVDTRNLYVPTSIKKCRIDFKKHLTYVESFGEREPNLPVYLSKKLDIIRCGGIEICGIEAIAIAKRKSTTKEVLERYVFVPNEATLDLNTLLRVNMQLVLENCQDIKLKIVELFKDISRVDLIPFGPIIHDILNDIPLIQTSITVLTDKFLDNPNITIENKSLSGESNCNIVVGENILQNTLILQKAFGVLKEAGFILTRESLSYEFNTLQFNNIQCLTEFRTENEKILLLRKKFESKFPICIKVSNENFEWIAELKEALNNNSNIIIYSQNEPISGILGLINCLRREPNANRLKCVFIKDDAPPFDPNHDFYKKQLMKNLIINVYQNSKWGTYRHLTLNKEVNIKKEHFYANTLVNGNLSSLRWIEGPLTTKSILPLEQKLIHVYYSALNFRDVMLATGRINANIISSDRIQQECVLGLEFAGCSTDGKRIMGLTTNSALSTLTKADKYLIWEVPNNWSLADAASVLVVYTTVLYCFFWEHKLKRSETVLIHSGAGGIGQAAIHVALHHGCIVYTTVGTEEKRKFLKSRFPELTDLLRIKLLLVRVITDKKLYFTRFVTTPNFSNILVAFQFIDKHIGNSRDTSFEQMIFEETNGRGVDIVLNSLAEEKLLASVRCLTEGGKFFEIGKFDFANNNPLRLMFLKKSASFHGIVIDKYFTSEPCLKQAFNDVFKKALANGYIKPLITNIFKTDEIEKAFKYMMTGKHIGKVLIEICKEEDKNGNNSSNILLKTGKLKYLCDSNACYIIVGGLGGFGLELVDWLILRGARNLILSSRRGLSNGYQSYRAKIWRSYGCLVKISTVDVATKKGCKELIEEANKIAPVAGIFNLAVVLKDALFENQNIENFITSFESKVCVTKLLDETSRILCPKLKNFVVFSSLSCGRGNAGQTNYGMANSVMERICELRQQDGLPAIAIQWGAVDDVGLVAKLQEQSAKIKIGGTMPQRIFSCLKVLDDLLIQKDSVVSSMVIAEKRNALESTNNIVNVVAGILGIKDVKIVGLHSTLPELGMDSLTSVEIKQTFEREFGVFLKASDIRNLTLAKLHEIQKKINSGIFLQSSITKMDLKVFDLLFNLISEESSSTLPVVKHKTKVTNMVDAAKVIFLPGIEGFAKVLEPLTKNLHIHALVVQFGLDNFTSSFNELVLSILPRIEKNISKTEPLYIIGYSYGTIISLEIVSLLEQKGYLPGHLICIDGSPEVLTKGFRKALELDGNASVELQLLKKFIAMYLPDTETTNQHKETVLECKTSRERLDAGSDILYKILSKKNGYSKDFCHTLLAGVCNRIEVLMKYKPNIPKIKSKISLFKSKQTLVKEAKYDYNLSEFFENPVEIQTFEGNHITILENLEMAEAIDKLLKKD